MKNKSAKASVASRKQQSRGGKTQDSKDGARVETRLKKIEGAINRLGEQLDASVRQQEETLRVLFDAHNEKIYSVLDASARHFDLIQKELVNILGILNDGRPGPQSSGAVYSRTGAMSEGMHRTPVDRRERNKP